jgi:hypothetical protein
MIVNPTRRQPGSSRLITSSSTSQKISVASAIVACIALSAIAHGRAATTAIATTLQQSRDALGATALQHGGVLLVESTATVSGLTGTGKSAAEIGGVRLAERTSTPPIAAGDGYDGAVFWNQDQSGLVWTDGSDAGVSQEIDAAYATGDTLFVPGSGGARVAWNGVRSTGRRQYATLTVTPRHSRLPMQVWINATTHLPARYVIPVGPVTNETDVSDYRPVDGLLVPHRVVTTSIEGNVSNFSVTSARIVANDAAALAKPKSRVDDFSINGNATTTSVPIDFIDNHVYLNVTLNGKGPYRFVFDTGGSNIIDPAVAKDLNVQASGLSKDSGTGAGTESSSYATIDSVKIGNAVVRHQVFLVEPIHKGFGMASGERVDGLIGFEVLARYVTTFDYAGRTLTFAMSSAAPANGAAIVPFVFFGSVPQVDCAIDGIPSQCTVDTGQSGSVSLYVPFVADHPQIVPTTHSAEGVNGYGVGGGHRGFMGRLRSLQVGSFAMHDLVAAYSTQNQGDFAFPFLAANLGGNLLKQFTVTFDYGRETMALQPNATFGEPDSYDRSGMLLVNNAGTIVVYAVRQGTPAASAGITKGDTIRSIDGVASPSLERVRHEFRGASGTVLHLQVVDKTGTPRTVTITLRDWV